MAAFHAYKFTHFYEAEKVNEHVRPEELGFWYKAQAIAFGIKSYKKPVDTVPPVVYKTVEIITNDKIQLQSWHLVHPIDSMVKGTVIMFHGHGGNKAGILSEAESFYSFGYNVFMTDFRAHGNSSGDVCTIGFDEAKDVKAAYDYIDSLGEKNIILWGISLGAAAEMKAIADYDLKPSKMILEMPFGSLTEAVKARCRLLGVPQQPTSTLLTFWGGIQHGFWAFDHNPEDYAKQIKCPVLLQWGVQDNRVTEKEILSIYNNLSTASKELVKYNHSGHQSLCVNEFDQWNKEVSAFLK